MAARRNMLVMAAQVTVIFMLPITENILIQNMNELRASGIFWILILLVGTIHITLGLIVILPARNEFFYFEFLDLMDKYDELQRKHERAEATGRVVYLALKSVRNFIGISKSTSGTLSIEDVRRYFAKLINTAVLNRDGVLGFSLSDRYSFIVYMYSDLEKLLKPFYGAQDDRISPENRTWKVTQGPVGLCYANKRLEIVQDLMTSPYKHEYLSPGDEKNYRSVAVIPIFYESPVDNTKTVIGVLWISSSKPSRFDELVHSSIFESLADILDVFFVFALSKLPGEAKFV